jgi:hypothetical protein
MLRLKWLVVAGVMVAVLLAGAAGAGARGLAGKALGSEVRLSSNAASQVNPAVAWNQTAGQYLVVWEDHRNAGTWGFDIYGRRLNANGGAVGADFRITGGTADASERMPAVVWNAAANEYLVVWEDWRNSTGPGSGADIYGRRIGANGVAVGADFRISTPTGEKHESHPAVSWDQTTNRYLVVWDDERAVATRGTDIFGRLLDATGVPVAADLRINRLATLASQVYPAVSAGSGEFLVVWEDHRDESDYRIFGRRVYSATGAVLGTDIRISGSAAESALVPAVTTNPTTGEYLVVWEDWRNFNPDVLRISTIYGRLVAADGTPLNRDLRVSSRQNESGAGGPAVAWNAGAGRFLVTWTDGRNVVMEGPDPVVGVDIYGRRLESDGSPAGADLQLTAVTSSEIDSAVAAQAGGTAFFVVWCDMRNVDTTGEDIYGRKVPG